MSVKISRTFQLLPDILSTNIDEKMHDLVKSKVLGVCSEENGYIIDLKDVSISHASISEATGLVDVSVVFDAVCVHPKYGRKFGGRICLVFEMGILVDVAGIFKILVPVCDNMIRVNGTEKEITYDQNENGEHFIRSTNDSSMLLEKGLLTRVVVSGVQYNPDTNAFNCFGDLII
jgi:DNA-directed RNA polymerase subunit E'/Rpb7